MFTSQNAVSLVAALACALGGLFLVPILMGSNETPWPQAGLAIGWIFYRLVLFPILHKPSS